MDAVLRREHLETGENPNAKVDYIVTLSGTISQTCRVDIRYIPDLAILKPASLSTYLETVGTMAWDRLEALGLTILNDLNNEVIPRWVQVTVWGKSADMAHRVTLEDRQPRWDNPTLLSRIGPL
jgi:NADPH-dependent 7-cyano-7-deazaguanine reductase QueF